MKMLIMMLLTIFLISCAPEIDPKLLCDISFQFKRCRCRCFSFKEIKSVKPKECNPVEEDLFLYPVNYEDISSSDSWDLPIKLCEGFAGFSNKDWAVHIKPYLRELKRYYEANKKELDDLKKKKEK